MTKLPAKKPKKTEDPSKLASAIKDLIGKHLEGKIEGDEILAITAQITQVVTTMHYSGPLPHPQHFKGYEDVLPGAAERILSMAENSMAHSSSMEQKQIAIYKQEVESGISDKIHGRRYGVFVILVLIACAFASLFVTDNPLVQAIFLGAATISGVVEITLGRKDKD